MAMPMSY